MSWRDIMYRMLPPIGGVPPHVTSPYGATEGRVPPSTIPHKGIDFNYVGGQPGRSNKVHPAINSPVDGIVTNAGQGNAGRIAIKDANGFSHEILHTQGRYVSIGDPVAAGQLIGTMGNTGTKNQHVHYQLKDSAGRRVDPSAFWDQQGPTEPNPGPPAYLQEYRQYLQRTEANPVDEFGDLVDDNRYPRLSRRIADQSPMSGDEILAPDRHPSFGDRFASWNASPEGVSPRNPYQPEPSEQPGRPRGIVSGKPMPQWIVPPPIFDFPKNPRAPGSVSRNGGPPQASVFDTGTAPVPYVSPIAFSPGTGGNVFENSVGSGDVRSPNNSADTFLTPKLLPELTSPLLQYLRFLKQRVADRV